MCFFRCSRCKGLRPKFYDMDEDPETFMKRVGEWFCQECEDDLSFKHKIDIPCKEIN